MFCEIDKSELMTIIPAGPIKCFSDRETGQSPAEPAFNHLLSSSMEWQEAAQQKLPPREGASAPRREEARASQQNGEVGSRVAQQHDDDQKDTQNLAGKRFQEIENNENNSEASRYRVAEDDTDEADDSSGWAGDQPTGSKRESRLGESRELRSRRRKGTADKEQNIGSDGNELTKQALSSEQTNQGVDATGQSAELTSAATVGQAANLIEAGAEKQKSDGQGEGSKEDVTEKQGRGLLVDPQTADAKNLKKQDTMANSSKQHESMLSNGQPANSAADADVSSSARIHKLDASRNTLEQRRETSRRTGADTGLRADAQFSNRQADVQEPQQPQPGTKLTGDWTDSKTLPVNLQQMEWQAKSADNNNTEAQSGVGSAIETLSERSKSRHESLPDGETAGEKAGRNAANDAAVNVQRIVHALRLAQGRNGEIRLRLHPPELGALRLEMHVKNGTLTARLEVESSAARDVLLENLPQLRERLAEHRIKVDQFDVFLPRDSSQGHSNDQQTNSGGYERPQTTAGRASRQTEPINGSEPRKWRADSSSQFDVVI